MRVMIQAMQVYKAAKVEKVRGSPKLHNSTPTVRRIMGKGTEWRIAKRKTQIRFSPTLSEQK